MSWPELLKKWQSAGVGRTAEFSRNAHGWTCDLYGKEKCCRITASGLSVLDAVTAAIAGWEYPA